MAGSPRTCIWVSRDTVDRYPTFMVLTYVPLSSAVLQTVHLQETVAATYFLAFLGHASELQRKQARPAAHGEFCPSHHLNSWSKKIHRNRHCKLLCGERNTTSHESVNSPEAICWALTQFSFSTSYLLALCCIERQITLLPPNRIVRFMWWLL